MSCTKHFLFFSWTHHSWHKTVSWAEGYESEQFDMWGRRTLQPYVTCQKQLFCSECGATKSAGYCGCDETKAMQCALYRSWEAGAPGHAEAGS